MIKRWAFSATELASPETCNGTDELIADVGESGIIVQRDGTVTNLFDDGTKGVPAELATLASDCETLTHQDLEPTEVWRDVVTNEDGEFIRFAESKD